ncbi:MAG TPA: hypothetical protein DCO72_09605 [Ruminococcus sp.]|nr:hypothetical protein [Ruminococcus sp.]
MKEKILLFLLCGMVMLFSSCGKETELPTAETIPQETISQLETMPDTEPIPEETTLPSGNDYTVTPEIIYDIPENEKPPIPEGQGGIFCYAYEPNAQNLIEQHEQIAEGTIENIIYTSIEERAFMQLDFTLTKPYYTDFQAGDKISVYVMGGFMPKNIFEEFFNKNFEDVLTDEISSYTDEKYVVNKGEFFDFPEIGDTWLLFFSKETEVFPEGSFGCWTMPEAIYTPLDENSYICNHTGKTWTVEQLQRDIAQYKPNEETAVN